MFANERQDKIYDLIKKNGAVTTSGLVEFFGVSIETIRRDLLAMEKQGRLSRVHGGAVEKVSMKPFHDLRQRNEEYSNQKRNLSLKAAEFICQGDIIGIDSGSTAIMLAEVIKEKFSKLTVVTHSLDVFNILCNHKDFEVILCGGHFLQNENAFFGALTLNMLNTLHINKSFIFPSAISLEYGICDYQNDLYQVQKKIIESSDDVYILADSTKFEKKALLKLDDMTDKYKYVTDCQLPQDLKKLYKENNISIYTGGSKQNGKITG